ncbi:O-antigen ligase-like membrane protein [Flavobacterium branchiophilum]|uniref:Hypothetical transmembrane protein n=1 Tax=Flavobacterium branchiophilum (strain FL-15) TaxID=1034807 RepID=G2Z767_FLABF|nr:Hypothetical transmembrane protein [Flavobacterium branchiophilum FL-15]
MNKIITFFKEDFLIILLIILASSSAIFLNEKLFLISVVIYILSLFFFLKKTINLKIYIFLTSWIVINILSFLVYNHVESFKAITFLSVTARILLPYFIIRIMGINSFLNKFERIIYVLTLISLPLFTIQLINPNLFFALSPLLSAFSLEEQQLAGGWYVGFFMFSGWAADRNCGFMWEPGAFAFMIILAMFIRFFKNNFTIDKKIIVYVIAIITTLSTMGFFVLFLMTLAFLLKFKSARINMLIIVILPIFIIFSVYFYLNSDFLAGKINVYVEVGSETWYEGVDNQQFRLSRLGIILFAFEESLKWPFGWGILENVPGILKYGKPVSGPNTYAELLLKWGWAGLIMFIYILKKTMFILFYNQRVIVKYLMTFSILMSVLTYNLANNTFLLTFIYIGILFNEKLILKKE